MSPISRTPRAAAYCAQGIPLALEAHLVGDCARAAGEALPVVDPEGVSRAEGRDLGGAHGRAGLGQQARPAGEGRGRGVGRARAVGRAERQHLPPGLAGGGQPVDEAVGRGAEAAARERGHMEQDSARTGKIHDADAVPLTPAHATRRIAGRLRTGMTLGGEMVRLVAGEHPDPHSVLGAHAVDGGVARARVPPGRRLGARAAAARRGGRARAATPRRRLRSACCRGGARCLATGWRSAIRTRRRS